MIWFDKDIQVKHKDGYLDARLLGVYTTPQEATDGRNIIDIVLEVIDNSRIILYSKNPSFLSAAEDYPDPDQIKAKYHNILLKLLRKIEKTELEGLLKEGNSIDLP